MSKPCVYLICNAHLDPVWQWQWEEGCAEALSTFRSMVEILHEHKDLIFNHNEAVLYDWIKEHDPFLFRQIQDLVKKGQWAVSGGWYLQPDVNLTSTESIIRQILEGRKFFRRYFNSSPEVAYNFDSFGHSAGLPQILKKSGYQMYIHMRPQQDQLELPSYLYRWQGCEGTEIAALRIPVGLYHTEYHNIKERLKQGTELALKKGQDIPVFWGIGNHGGGATREDLNQIDDYVDKENRVDFCHSTPDLYYQAVKDSIKEAPVFKGGLQRVFTGCYTSLSRLKRKAIQSQGLVRQAESASALAWWLKDAPYPQRDIREMWRGHLFNDFHDILPGSCTQPAEKDALDLYGKVMDSARRIRMKAMTALNQRFENSPYLPLTVVNTNPSLTQIPVEAEFMLSHRPKWEGEWHVKLSTLSGENIVCQEEQPEALLPFNGWRRKISFFSSLPGIGTANFRLEVKKGKAEIKKFKPRLSYEINPHTELIEKLYGPSGEQILSGPLMQPLVIKDSGDSWGTGIKKYCDKEGVFELKPGSSRVVEKGPVRVIRESEFIYEKSSIFMRTISYSKWPVLEYRLRISWNHRHRRLKISIPTHLKQDHVHCEVPGGMTQRPANGEEHVHRQWLFVKGQINGKPSSMGIVNSGQHGFDFKDGEVRLSLLRSAAYCHEQGLDLKEHPGHKCMDMGEHFVRLLVVPGEPDSVLRKLPGLADWLSQPPFALAHLPVGNFDALDLLTLSPENVRLLACKRSEDGDALVIRIQEAAGIPTKAEVHVKKPDMKYRVSLKPLEIKTLCFQKDGRALETNLLEK
jgi:alpha-mannosidase